MSFRIVGLDPFPFKHLFGLSDTDLSSLGVIRYRVDQKPGFPDRIGLVDLEPGESVMLLNYMHQPAQTPYQSSHAIFIKEGAIHRYDQIGVVPEALWSRLLSVRGFDSQGMMIDADVVEGRRLEEIINRLFASSAIQYLHIHYAKRGCYAAQVNRL